MNLLNLLQIFKKDIEIYGFTGVMYSYLIIFGLLYRMFSFIGITNIASLLIIFCIYQLYNSVSVSFYYGEDKDDLIEQIKETNTEPVNQETNNETIIQETNNEPIDDDDYTIPFESINQIYKSVLKHTFPNNYETVFESSKFNETVIINDLDTMLQMIDTKLEEIKNLNSKINIEPLNVDKI